MLDRASSHAGSAAASPAVGPKVPPPRARRLTALALNPDPLFEECQHRIEELRREAALQDALSDDARRRVSDLRQHVRREISWKPPKRHALPMEAHVAAPVGDQLAKIAIPPRPGHFNETKVAQEQVSFIQQVENRDQGLMSSAWPQRPRREAQPLAEVHLQEANSEQILERLKMQGAVNTLGPPDSIDNVAWTKVHSQGLRCDSYANVCKNSADMERYSNYSNLEGASSAVADDASPIPQLMCSETDESPNDDLLHLLTLAGLSPSAITERIDRGCIDALFDSLARYQDADSCLIHAEMVGLLLVLVSWSRAQWPSDPPFSSMNDLLLDLRCSLITVRESLRWASAGIEPAPELHIRLCESCVCFTAHAEFKELLLQAPATLQAMLSVVSSEELCQEPHFAFLYASLVFNLCRSREDFVDRAVLLSELREDSLIGHLYEDVLKSADAGSPELAEQLRSHCASRSSILALLIRCSECASAGARVLMCFAMRLLCRQPKHRAPIAAAGGMKALIDILEDSPEPSHSKAIQDAATEAVAQVCVTVSPSSIEPGEQMRAIVPLLRLMHEGRERQQVDAAMGFTHLLTAGDDLRSAAVQAGAWQLCQELLLSQSEALRRCVTEAMCNLTAHPAVRDLCAAGGGDREIEAFASLCLAQDRATQVAAAGALATLAMHPNVAVRIAGGARWQRLIGLLGREDPDIQHRVVACLCHICGAEGTVLDARQQVWVALKERCDRLGFVSCEAEALARGTVQAYGPIFNTENCNVYDLSQPLKGPLMAHGRSEKGRSGSAFARRQTTYADKAGQGGA